MEGFWPLINTALTTATQHAPAVGFANRLKPAVMAGSTSFLLVRVREKAAGGINAEGCRQQQSAIAPP